MVTNAEVDIELPAYSPTPKPPKPAHLSSSLPHYTPDNNPPETAHNITPPPNPRSRLFRLALPLACLIGAAITAATTYALVKRVQHLIANATVSSDAAYWASQARYTVYDRCYNGCGDVPDPACTFKACQRTTSHGPACDGTKIWNWRDRYPDTCLASVGEELRAIALAAKKQGYRNRLAIIILTVLAGLLGARVAYVWIIRWARHRDKKAAEKRARPPRYRKKPPGSATTRIIPRLKTLFSLACMVLLGRPASAYPCTGHGGRAADQYFGSPNGTIVGVVHGWLSDCYDTTDCIPVCSQTCSSTDSCTTSCTNSCYTVTYTDKGPWDYVRAMAVRVERECGFQLVSGLIERGGPGAVRVANAKIERDRWVSISVNGYNVTRADETDEMVLCLHGLGG